jgi:hypothetical protein
MYFQKNKVFILIIFQVPIDETVEEELGLLSNLKNRFFLRKYF